MFQHLLSLVLLAGSADGPGACEDTLLGRSPNALEIPVANDMIAGWKNDNSLVFQSLGPDRLMVLAGVSEPDDLVLNGSQQRFAWHRLEGRAVLVLEHCELAGMALAMTAGTAFGEWVGADFHVARPAADSEAISLQTSVLQSEALGSGREIYLVVGAGWDGGAGDPLVVSGDGLAGGSFGAIVESLAGMDGMRPIAFASARFGEGLVDGSQTALRSAEYHQPDDSADESRRLAYLAHERFFFDEFLPHVIAELGGEVGSIISFGISSSASFALEQALKRPEVINGAIAASPPISAATRSLGEQSVDNQMIWLWCGTLEPLFCNPAQQFAEQHGFSLETRPATHASALWEEALSATLKEMIKDRD